MKLSAFELKVAENPWNSIDQKEHEKYQDGRNQQIKNWRNIIYKDIEGANNFSGEAERIPDDHFESGKIDSDESSNGETYYCDACGAISSKDGKCYYCEEIDKEKK